MLHFLCGISTKLCFVFVKNGKLQWQTRLRSTLSGTKAEASFRHAFQLHSALEKYTKKEFAICYTSLLWAVIIWYLLFHHQVKECPWNAAAVASNNMWYINIIHQTAMECMPMDACKLICNILVQTIVVPSLLLVSLMNLWNELGLLMNVSKCE